MIAWVNLAVLVFASLFFLYYYVLSVSPAALEKVIGAQAYRKCGRFRVIAALFETVSAACYIAYRFFPVSSPLLEHFPWDWWISALLAALIGLPSLALMFIGMRDAGSETMTPKKEHGMYGGIYKKIRHPQAVGEVFAWLWIALLLDSPFLAVFSLAYFPIFLVMCHAEEQDLLLRFGDAYADYMRNTGAFIPKRNSQ
ncbi:MAG: methyltransferase family protein [Chloroflexota bacterium]